MLMRIDAVLLSLSPASSIAQACNTAASARRLANMTVQYMLLQTLVTQ